MKYELLTVLYALQILMDKGMYDDAKDLINKLIKTFEKES